MAKPRLSITTPEGTFSRQTARNYTHIVLAGPTRHEIAEAERLSNLAHRSKVARRYAQLKDSDGRPMDPRWLDSVADWAGGEAKQAAHLANLGPITADRGPWGVLSWNGRLDLAMAEATRDTARRYRSVKVYEVATGNLVASIQN